MKRRMSCGTVIFLHPKRKRKSNTEYVFAEETVQHEVDAPVCSVRHPLWVPLFINNYKMTTKRVLALVAMVQHSHCQIINTPN